MRDINLIVSDIQQANDNYRTLQLSHVIEQSEILRTLSCCYLDLVDHKREARTKWLNVYNKTQGTNAAKEREADTKVMEYDTINYLLKAVDIQIQSIRSTISANKQ